MHLSKTTSLVILALTSIASSRTMFALFNDPEGPNLLIVAVASLIVYGVSYAAYSYLFKRQEGLTKLLLAILVQILFVTGLFLILK